MVATRVTFRPRTRHRFDLPRRIIFSGRESGVGQLRRFGSARGASGVPSIASESALHDGARSLSSKPTFTNVKVLTMSAALLLSSQACARAIS
jgi:hypothetical protein